MNKNIGIVIGVIALVIVVGGIYASMNNKNDAMMEKEKMEQQAMENTKMADEKAMMEKKVTTEKDAMKKVGSYESYAPEKVMLASATHDVVLFFHASWCPSCRALNSDIENNLSAIPEGVSILKTDYDKETKLKKKYGVTYQHTLVQVDKDGNLIKKWSGSSKLTNLLSQIQ